MILVLLCNFCYDLMCLGCTRPIWQTSECTGAAHQEPSLPIHPIFLQHPLWPFQRGCGFRPWIPLQSPWGCPNCCFSRSLAQYPRLWCTYSACEASWEEHQVGTSLECKYILILIFIYTMWYDGENYAYEGMWMLFWQFQRAPCSPCVVWIWLSTVISLALQCTSDSWVMASQLDVTMICGLAGVSRSLFLFVFSFIWIVYATIEY